MTPALLTVGGVIVSALLSYLAVVRKLSGSVGSSTAAQLWEEARRIRKEYSTRIDVLEAVVAELRVKVEHCEEENVRLRMKGYGLGDA